MSDDLRSFWAWLVLTMGGLIVLLCGPCTLFFGGGALFELLRGGDPSLAGFILAVALILGGIPTVGGVVLVINGFQSLQKMRRPPAAGPPPPP